jgi:hypothetical protein
MMARVSAKKLVFIEKKLFRKKFSTQSFGDDNQDKALRRMTLMPGDLS